MTTEKLDDDFAAIAWMIRQGSSSWVGPTPRAGQARWAAKARRWGMHPRAGSLGVAFTAFVFLAVVGVAVAAASGGIVSMQRTVSGVISARVRAPIPPATVSPTLARTSTPTAQPTSTPQPTVRPTEPEDGGAAGATPQPVESGDDHGGGGNSGPGGGGSSGPGGGSDD